MTDPRYPIGKFEMKAPFTEEIRRKLIEDIASTPAKLRAAIAGLSPQQLDTPYREGGWTVRQVVHHLPDSHLNAVVRCRLTLTEQEPTVKPYDETRWAELEDARTAPIGPSLSLLESLHARWVILLRSLTPADFKRTYRHPESGVADLDRLLGVYAWHGRHHVAQITALRDRMNWK